MDKLIRILKEQGLTIGSCESLTAGLFTSRLAEVSGASAVLKGGIVTYMTACKIDVAGVEKSIIDTYGVISRECAADMAIKAKELLHVDVCVSFSGNAGPDTMDDKAAGLVYMGIALREKVVTYECNFTGNRNEVRQKSVEYMVNKLIEQLET